MRLPSLLWHSGHVRNEKPAHCCRIWRLSLSCVTLPQLLKDEFVFIHDLFLPFLPPSCFALFLSLRAKRLNIPQSRESLHISINRFLSLFKHIQHELPYLRLGLTGVMAFFFFFSISC